MTINTYEKYQNSNNVTNRMSSKPFRRQNRIEQDPTATISPYDLLLNDRIKSEIKFRVISGLTSRLVSFRKLLQLMLNSTRLAVQNNYSGNV